VRAGALDLAVVTARPPFRPVDDERPRLTETVADESVLRVAVCATGRFAGRDRVSVSELDDVGWIDSPSARQEPAMGVWPGLGGRPRVVHQARDWLAKLHLVAADCGVTTAPPALAGVLPEGVRLLAVDDAPPERRRVMVVRLPGRVSEPVATVVDTVVAVFPRG
jgi:DNA-binding transcriptional LysR family regulator